MPKQDISNAGAVRLLKTAEAATYLRTSKYKIYQLVHTGELPVLQDGPWRFDKIDLDRYVERTKRQRDAARKEHQ